MNRVLLFFLGFISGGVFFTVLGIYFFKSFNKMVEDYSENNFELNQGLLKQDIKANYAIELVELKDTLKLYNFENTKNEVVFLHFWDFWCAPCIEEFSRIDSLYLDYKDKMSFVFISRDDPDLALERIQNKFDFPFYHLKKELPYVYKHSAIPQTYIISKEGQIVHDKSGKFNWNLKIIRNFLDSLILHENDPTFIKNTSIKTINN